MRNGIKKWNWTGVVLGLLVLAPFAHAQSLPDFTITPAGNLTSPSSATVGVSTQFKIDIKNQGTAKTAGTFNSQINSSGFSTPTSIAGTADFNADNIPDLVVTNYNINTVSILLGNGDGTYTKSNKATGGGPWSSAIGDFNGDTKPDIVVGNDSANTVSVFLNNGDGTFAAKQDAATGLSPDWIATGDFNGDGRADIVTANRLATAGVYSVSVLLSNGDGTFQPKVNYPVTYPPSGIAVADVDGDGKLDLAVTNWSGGATPGYVSIYRGNGNGTFMAPANYVAGTFPANEPNSIALGDLNGDNKPDIVVGNNVGANKVIVLLNLNNGLGAFGPGTAYAGVRPASVSIADMNGDGKNDVVAGNGFASNSFSLFLGNGDGSLNPKVDTGVGTSVRTAIVGDMNSDSVPDVITVNTGANTISTVLAKGSFSSVLKMAPNNNPLPSEVSWLGTAPAGPLARSGGQTTNFSISYTPVAGDVGTQYFQICAEQDITGTGAITESDEGNNCSGWTPVTIAGPPAPDLTVATPTITSPSATVVGTPTPFMIDIENIGTAGALTTLWSPKDSNRNWFSISMSSDGRYQTAVVNAGQIYTSSDYGVTWSPKDSSRSWRDVALSSSGQYQTATVYGGQIYTSSNYGATWSATESSRQWNSVALSSSGQYQTATEYGGQIYTSSNYGGTWSATESSRQWNSVALSSSGQYQTATEYGGQIYTSSDYGNTWSPKAPDLTNWVAVAMSSDGRYQTAVVTSGQIYTSSDYGNSWSQSSGPDQTWQGIALSADGKYQTAVDFGDFGAGGQIYMSSDYGNTWLPEESNRNWHGVAMSSDGRYQAAVELGGQIYELDASFSNVLKMKNNAIPGDTRGLRFMSTATAGPLAASGGQTNNFSISYTPVAGDVGTKYFSICANQDIIGGNGGVDEGANTGNNCSDWTPVDIQTPPPTISFYASGASTAYIGIDDSAFLTWTTDAASCKGDVTPPGFSTGAGDPPNSTGQGVEVGPWGVVGTHPYQIDCYTSLYSPSDPGAGGHGSAVATVNVVVPGAKISALPLRITLLHPTTVVTAQADNVSSCSVTGPSGSGVNDMNNTTDIDGSHHFSKSYTTNSLTGQSVFSISCTGLVSGSNPTGSVTVRFNPIFTPI